MKRFSFYLMAFLAISFFTFPSIAQKSKSEVGKFIDKNEGKYKKLAKTIWDHPEMGYLETQSSALLQKLLQEEGFTIQKGVAGLPTAFIASYGTSGPVIGILGEFDALPGLSQQAIPEKKPVIEGAPGHGCGHHLFGVGSAAAAIGVKHWLKSTKPPGTIRYFGCPAEEGGSGKVYMVRAGLFKDVDIVLHWHPADVNSASPFTTLANISAKFSFTGVASHAAVAPEKGRSALDGVEAMDYMVNMLREHIPQETRIHYIITDGGDAPNIVPANAEVFYYVRYKNAKDLMGIFERVTDAARGAALGTGTTMNYEIIGGVYSILPNLSLAKIMDANLKTVGGVHYTPEEMQFAKEIRKTLINVRLPVSMAETVLPFKPMSNSASSDVGDVSWNVPTAGVATACWIPGTPPHSWQAVACGGTDIAMKGMMNAAKVMAFTAVDLFSNPLELEVAKKEFLENRGDDYKYVPVLGDREPPLDYRK
jgi:aminobenzoyl-glutamate utilization protein B